MAQPPSPDARGCPTPRVDPAGPRSPVSGDAHPQGQWAGVNAPAAPPVVSLTVLLSPVQGPAPPRSAALSPGWSCSSSAQKPFEGSPHPGQSPDPFARHPRPPTVWSTLSPTNHLHTLPLTGLCSVSHGSPTLPRLRILLFLSILSPESSPRSAFARSNPTSSSKSSSNPPGSLP